MSVEEHRKRGLAELPRARVAIITVSDTRTLESDETGLSIAALLEGAGHEVLARTIVPDEAGPISHVLRHWLASEAHAVILNGGTGIAARDGTVEVVRCFLEKELEGFGELFRALSFQQVGAAAMLSRAVAGIARGKAVFSVPGSRKAAQLAMESLILPELRHIVFEVKK